MRPCQTLFAAPLLLLFAACGGETSAADAVDAGYSSLNGGSYTEAVSSFDSALEGLGADSDQYLSAKVGRILAQCHLDAGKAREELLAMPKDSGVGAKDYSEVVAELTSAAKAAGADGGGEIMNEAVAILEAGKTEFPDYDKWDALLKRTGDEAASLGSADVMEKLKGLGYIGD